MGIEQFDLRALKLGHVIRVLLVVTFYPYSWCNTSETLPTMFGSNQVRMCMCYSSGVFSAPIIQHKKHITCHANGEPSSFDTWLRPIPPAPPAYNHSITLKYVRTHVLPSLSNTATFHPRDKHYSINACMRGSVNIITRCCFPDQAI